MLKLFALLLFMGSIVSPSFASLPRMVVLLVIDNMSEQQLQQYWPYFGDKGFKRLAAEGRYCRNVSVPYLSSQPSQGYATLSTGAFPSQHGIIADKFFNSLKNTVIECVDDDQYRKLNPLPVDGTRGYSGSKLLCTTLADHLQINTQNASVVIGISPEPQGAILTTGHNADGCYWMNEDNGWWITSSNYADSLPAWVQEFNRKRLFDIYLNREWNTFFPLDSYKQCLTDNNKYEQGIGQQITFPYNLAGLKSKYGYKLLKTIPWGNSYTKDFAIATIINEKMGKDSIPDYLSVAFTISRAIDKSFGLRSVEMQDMYLRLDQDLGHFLDFLDDHCGKKNFILVLTSSGGTADEPAFMADFKIPAGYFKPTQTIYLLKSYLNILYGNKEWLPFYYNKNIYFNRQLIDESKLSLSAFQEKAAGFLIQSSGIYQVLTSTSLLANNYTSGVFQKVQRTFHAGRSGDLVIVLEPGWAETNYIETIRNNTLPVAAFWYGGPITPGITVRDIQITDVMPTLCVLSGISMPETVAGTAIGEIVGIQP